MQSAPTHACFYADNRSFTHAENRFFPYATAVFELPLPANRPDRTLVTRLGVAATDVASGHLIVGEFTDDEVRFIRQNNDKAKQIRQDKRKQRQNLALCV